MRIVTVARKPCAASSTTANVVEHEAGAINIEACRIPHQVSQEEGRWPANVLLLHRPGCETDGCDPSCPVADLDRQSGTLTSGSGCVKRESAKNRQGNTSSTYGAESRKDGEVQVTYGDSGGASRFFKVFWGEGSEDDSSK